MRTVPDGIVHAIGHVCAVGHSHDADLTVVVLGHAHQCDGNLDGVAGRYVVVEVVAHRIDEFVVRVAVFEEYGVFLCGVVYLVVLVGA